MAINHAIRSAGFPSCCVAGFPTCGSSFESNAPAILTVLQTRKSARRSWTPLKSRTSSLLALSFLLLVQLLSGISVGSALAQSAASVSSQVPEADLQRIEQALPSQAIVPPGKTRKLLIFDLNVGYGGHPSAKTATEAFTRMGAKTGAFQAVYSQDPKVFLPDSLRQFDAVFFNNNVGNLFTDPLLRQSLIDFVYSGGGLMGVHGTTVAFTQWPGAIEDWPEFGILLGGRGANHRENKEHVFIKLDDLGHPLNRVFAGQGFDYRDEFFRVHDTYSRSRVRVLLSIDTEKTDLKQGPAYGNLIRADNDYALAWIRNYGRGRVFYCTVAHNHYVFWDARMLQFYLGAIQFAVGDLACPTLPSASLTPPVKAQEQLGWRMGAQAGDQVTLFDSIELAARLGMPYLSATLGQPVSREIAKPFGLELGEAERLQIRLKLDSAGIRLLGCEILQLPSSSDGLRAQFDFIRKMGIEVVSANPSASHLDLLEGLCQEMNLQLALHGPAWTPQEILRRCQDRSRHMGAAGDITDWCQAKLSPIDALRLLNDRLITLQFSPSSDKGEEKEMQLMLREVGRLKLKPAMMSMALPASQTNASPAVESALSRFNEASIALSRESGSASLPHSN